MTDLEGNVEDVDEQVYHAVAVHVAAAACSSVDRAFRANPELPDRRLTVRSTRVY
ncbi:MAG: hypothetical protein U1B78_00155 [Dehalococcoidia bacterium]|nr:hypothetical protein [Dehalococcoidia bacterium]